MAETIEKHVAYEFFIPRHNIYNRFLNHSPNSNIPSIDDNNPGQHCIEHSIWEKEFLFILLSGERFPGFILKHGHDRGTLQGSLSMQKP